METIKIKWDEKDVFVHHISSQGDYVLVSYSPEKEKLFKIAVADLDDNSKKLCANLLGQVEKRLL